MTYILDTHILVWLLDNNKRLKPSFRVILADPQNTFIIPAIILAEIKHLCAIKRINIDLQSVLSHISKSANAIIYPIDQAVVERMPRGLNIHDALIVGAGLVYKELLSQNVEILTEDIEIINSGLLKVPS